MEQLAIEVQTIIQSIEQQPQAEAQPQQSAAVQPVTPVAAISSPAVSARSVSAGAVQSNSARAAAPRQMSTPTVSSSNSSSSAGASSAASESAARIQTISAQFPELQKRVAKNGSNITKLQKSSIKTTKNLINCIK